MYKPGRRELHDPSKTPGETKNAGAINRQNLDHGLEARTIRCPNPMAANCINSTRGHGEHPGPPRPKGNTPTNPRRNFRNCSVLGGRNWSTAAVPYLEGWPQQVGLPTNPLKSEQLQTSSPGLSFPPSHGEIT